MRYYGGVDLGGTNIKAVVGTPEHTEAGTAIRPTPQAGTGIAVTEAVLDVLRDACEDAGVAPTRLEAAGIGSIGPLDLIEGMVITPANLPSSMREIPLVGPLESLIDSSAVYLHNDTTAGVIGERFFADQNPDDMVYLTMSTGIGAGIAVDGHVLAGWDGNAGEVGHVTVDSTGEMTCGCGRDGHWEAYASGSAIPRYARQLARQRELVTETALPVDADDFSAADVFAQPADPVADLVIEQIGRWNALGVATITHAYAPILISIGGAVALNNPDTILDPIRASIDELVMTNVPEIRLTELGGDVVVKGALASAMTGGTGDRRRVQL